ncbi:MAG: hypothetical protein WC835_01750 [Candidatus Paceibacterota bacterium]|jgi:septal ring factor EnvC (AmiA/AmiB activator)
MFDLQKTSASFTKWIGSTSSLMTHTILFAGSFLLVLLGVNFDKVLLILTTAVSLEAIYLAIFIQLTINRNTIQLHEVGKDLEELSEDIEDIQEDVDELSEDVGEIQENVEEIQEEEPNENAKLEKIEQSLLTIVREIEELKKKS